MKKYLKILKDSVSTEQWSNSVQCSRTCDIVIKDSDSEKTQLIFSKANNPVCQTITLWPKDEDWICDCNTQDDPCQHILASAIWLNKFKNNPQQKKNKKRFHLYRI